MTIYQGDLKMLLGPFGTAVGPRVPVVSMITSSTASGNIIMEEIELEVTILDGNRERMTPWTRSLCHLFPGDWSPNGVPRLDGPFLKNLLFVASVPDHSSRLYASTTTHELPIPNLNLATNPGHHPAIVQTPLTPGTSVPPRGGWLAAVGGKMGFPPPAAGVP